MVCIEPYKCRLRMEIYLYLYILSSEGSELGAWSLTGLDEVSPRVTVSYNSCRFRIWARAKVRVRVLG